MLLNWDDNWDLDVEKCPCDQHFLDWLEYKNLSEKVIFHMGTGLHHLIGKTLSKSDKNFLIFAITAAPTEYKEYMQTIMDDPKVGWRYKAIFGDIYQLDKRQYNKLDIVNLFHLCEFTNEVRTQGFGHTDKDIIKMFLDSLTKKGYILTYVNSFGFNKTNDLFNELENENLIQHVEDYKTLRIWTKL